jgi:hypothetical protein
MICRSRRNANKANTYRLRYASSDSGPTAVDKPGPGRTEPPHGADRPIRRPETNAYQPLGYSQIINHKS